MLFPYQYVPHQMEKMQEFIDFIFAEVWCKASSSGTYNVALFNANPDLKEVMDAFYISDAAGADFFCSHVESIYDHFATLTPPQISQIKQWYQANNDIERTCANDPTLHTARYSDISPIHEKLSEALAIFFKKLYSKDLLDLAALKKKIGEIDDHYHDFMVVNNKGKCPFCGIGDVKNIHHTKREAYDHYLPKGHYPFNTINFHNLAPACHECNSTYKLTKDPVRTTAGRRKAFYPYSNTGHSIDIRITLSKPDVDHLTPGDIKLEFGPAMLSEEIETWKDVYGIEERYKAKCCSGDAKDWLEQIRIFRDAYGIDPAAVLNTLQQQAVIAPLANSNFLKKAFLEGCERVGLFNP